MISHYNALNLGMSRLMHILLTLYFIAAAFSFISVPALLHWLVPALSRPGLHTTSRIDLNISLASWAALYSIPRVTIVAHRMAFFMVYRVPLNLLILILFLSFFPRSQDPTFVSKQG